MLANWTGIPVFKLTEEETTRLLRMEDELHKRIIGQEEAVKARLAGDPPHPRRPEGPASARRARSSSPARPVSVRPSCPRRWPSFLFGDDDALIQIDMGEFHDRFTASRLFGAPPGYVGYEEGGQLTEKVRRKPFSVVLFDEIEKAHQEIYNTLLQVLEDGRLTDGQGRTVDFKNTVLIFTSNLGHAGHLQGGRARLRPGQRRRRSNYERMKHKVNDELKKHFRPEFLNRIDDIVVFHQLTEERDHHDGRPHDHPGGGGSWPTRTWPSSSPRRRRRCWRRRGFDPVLGARPLRRTIQREIEDQLSEKILFGEVSRARSSSWTSRVSTPTPPRAPGPPTTRPSSPSAVSRSRSLVPDAPPVDMAKGE